MGFLDKNGLSYLWQKITSRYMPTKSLTTAEYNALSEEEKMVDVQYIITDDNGDGGYGGGITIEQVNEAIDAAISSIPTVEEYDTYDGWHVRKWANGYVELMKKVTISVPLSSWVNAGAGDFVYSIGIIPAQTFPFVLQKKYYENCSLMYTALWGGLVHPSGDMPSDLLNKTNTYTMLKYSKPSYNLTNSVSFYVTGLWK